MYVLYFLFVLYILSYLFVIAIKKLWYEKAKFGIVYKNIYAYNVGLCTSKQMNPEHECKTLNFIFSHCNIKTFNMVQLMEQDSDKGQINKD